MERSLVPGPGAIGERGFAAGGVQLRCRRLIDDVHAAQHVGDLTDEQPDLGPVDRELSERRQRPAPRQPGLEQVDRNVE